jgi:hypothetical protein
MRHVDEGILNAYLDGEFGERGTGPVGERGTGNGERGAGSGERGAKYE